MSERAEGAREWARTEAGRWGREPTHLMTLRSDPVLTSARPGIVKFRVAPAFCCSCAAAARLPAMNAFRTSSWPCRWTMRCGSV